MVTIMITLVFGILGNERYAIGAFWALILFQMIVPIPE